MDLPQSTQQDATVFHYKLMDLNDILSHLPDILTTTGDNYILDVVGILDPEHLDNIQHGEWFA